MIEMVIYQLIVQQLDQRMLRKRKSLISLLKTWLLLTGWVSRLELIQLEKWLITHTHRTLSISRTKTWKAILLRIRNQRRILSAHHLTIELACLSQVDTHANLQAPRQTKKPWSNVLIWLSLNCLIIIVTAKSSNTIKKAQEILLLTRVAIVIYAT